MHYTGIPVWLLSLVLMFQDGTELINSISFYPHVRFLAHQRDIGLTWVFGVQAVTEATVTVWITSNKHC